MALIRAAHCETGRCEATGNGVGAGGSATGRCPRLTRRCELSFGVALVLRGEFVEHHLGCDIVPVKGPRVLVSSTLLCGRHCCRVNMVWPSIA